MVDLLFISLNGSLQARARHRETDQQDDDSQRVLIFHVAWSRAVVPFADRSNEKLGAAEQSRDHELHATASGAGGSVIVCAISSWLLGCCVSVYAGGGEAATVVADLVAA